MAIALPDAEIEPVANMLFTLIAVLGAYVMALD